MKILDRYIFRSFLTTLILWTVSFVGIYVVFDLLSNVDSYFSSDSERSAVSILGEYYFYRTFLFIDIILALLVLVSALTVASSMLRRNEIIALMALGVSPRRVVTPILIAALTLSAAAFWTREYYLPSHIVQLVKTPKELGEKNTVLQVRRATDALTRITLDGQSVLPDEKRIDRPKFTLPVLLAPFGNELSATSAQWRPQEGKFPDGYLLKGVDKPAELLTSPSLDIRGLAQTNSQTTQQTGEKSAETSPTPAGDAAAGDAAANPTAQTDAAAENSNNILPRTILYSPFDTPELAPDECFVACGIEPEFLAVGESWKLYASTAQLITAAKNASLPLNSKDLQIRVHSRIVRPLADLLPLLIGLPFLFLKNDQSPFKGMAVGIVFAGLYMGISYSALFLGMRFDWPILAAWTPILVFSPIVVNLFADLLEIKIGKKRA